jgi:phage terminase large subunit-like protein
MWDPCIDRERRPSTTERQPLFVGIDAGIKHDNAARVAVKWDDAGENLVLVSHRIWKPTPLEPLNLEDTIEADLRELNDRGDVVEILVDPYQMHRSITTLVAAGVPIREFAQTTANCTLMGQTLFDLLTGQNFVLYPDDELRGQALSTVAIENPRGWRLAKENTSHKIDAIVALSMACVSAMAHRGEIGSRAARGFNPAAHVARERIAPYRGEPVYVAQTLDGMPATVIAQSDHGGITVLAALASQGSLKRPT